MLTGKELRDFRNLLGLSLRDVERETYISKKWIIRIESEEHTSLKLQHYLELYYKDKRNDIVRKKFIFDSENDD